MIPAYAELHCLSNFSFQRGASHPEELVAQAAAFGYAAIALTDECSLAGVVRAHRALQALPGEHRPRLIIGSELQLADGPCIVLLATTRAGYGQLSRLITQARRAAVKGTYQLTRAMLDAACSAGTQRDCLALLVPPAAFPPAAFPPSGRPPLTAIDTASTTPEGPQASPAHQALEADAVWLAQRYPGRAWMAVTVRLDGRDRARITLLRRIARSAGIPAVAASGALMHARERRPLADVMTALRLHCSVAEAGLALAANAEQRLHDRDTLARRYPPALLAETLAVAERCTFSLDELRYEYPAELV
ncbi:MAG TPA: PHP domain-containing protein, partial [Thauera sp.]|nr:PHP domain-containing protein [Thauera sp.]